MALIWKMLKAGYMEQWAYNCTFSVNSSGFRSKSNIGKYTSVEAGRFCGKLKEKASIKVNQKKTLSIKGQQANYTTSEEKTEQIGKIGMSNKEKGSSAAAKGRY